jgi:hypothetical protein
MHSISTLLLLALLPSVLSIKITSPSDDSELAIGGANQATTVQWDSVNTDPTSFAVVLVNQVSLATRRAAKMEMRRVGWDYGNGWNGLSVR